MIRCNFNIYTEVLQDAPVQLMRDGRVLSASSCSLTVTNECLEGIYRDIDFFKDKLVLRPSEISNCPEVIARSRRSPNTMDSTHLRRVFSALYTGMITDTSAIKVSSYFSI